jgi:hypothetical protein
MLKTDITGRALEMNINPSPALKAIRLLEPSIARRRLRLGCTRNRKQQASDKNRQDRATIEQACSPENGLADEAHILGRQIPSVNCIVQCRLVLQ